MHNETKGGEEHCWATTRHWGGHVVAGQVPSVLETIYSVPYVYWIPNSTWPDRTWFGDSLYLRLYTQVHWVWSTCLSFLEILIPPTDRKYAEMHVDHIKCPLLLPDFKTEMYQVILVKFPSIW